jgi:hypothetical protein
MFEFIKPEWYLQPRPKWQSNLGRLGQFGILALLYLSIVYGLYYIQELYYKIF